MQRSRKGSISSARTTGRTRLAPRSTLRSGRTKAPGRTRTSGRTRWTPRARRVPKQGTTPSCGATRAIGRTRWAPRAQRNQKSSIGRIGSIWRIGSTSSIVSTRAAWNMRWVSTDIGSVTGTTSRRAGTLRHLIEQEAQELFEAKAPLLGDGVFSATKWELRESIVVIGPRWATSAGRTSGSRGRREYAWRRRG